MSINKKIKVKINNIIENFNSLDKDKIIKDLRVILLEDEPKSRTQAVRFSIVKKMFKKITDDKEFLSKIKPDQNITDGIVLEDAKRRDGEKLFDINLDLVEKINSYQHSNDIYELALYLLMITGRRVSELMEAVFINVKGNRNIKIDGVKKRTDEGICEFIPLINKTKFFKLYKKFKIMLKHVSSLSSFHRNLGRNTKKKLGQDFNPHKMRKIYANYSFRFRNKLKEKLNTHIKRVLCHMSINASLNYTGININFDKDIIK